jgi:hypothetical protein
VARVGSIFNLEDDVSRLQPLLIIYVHIHSYTDYLKCVVYFS